jgi:hypothetical protein
MRQFFTDTYYFLLALEPRYKIVLFLVITLLLLAAIMVLIVLRERSRKNSVETRERRISRNVEPIIQEIIFSEYDGSEFKDSIKKINRIVNSTLYGKSNMAILNELILYYHRNLGGEAFNRLEMLYREIGLKQIALDTLKNGEWHIKAKAINDLSTMRMGETLYDILQFTDDENINVRYEAQYAAVKLGGKKAMSFLDDLDTPMSEWQQIRLLDQSLKFEYELIDRVGTWLKSTNNSVVVFGLMIMRHLNQYHEKAELRRLLYHKDEKVQEKAIETARELAYVESLENMHEVYELTKKVRIKKQILRAMGELGGSKEVGFLRETISREKEYDLVFEAAKSLKRMGRRDVLISYKEQELSEKGESIVKHILDDRI